MRPFQVVDNDVRTPLVGVIMGSITDFDPCMKYAVEVLEELKVLYEVRVVSAHRTPNRMHEYATKAEERGLKVIIAGAGGAAHLPGMVSCHTLLPVFGVPVQSNALRGLDSLLSIAQMPRGIPTPTLSIGASGAANAALAAVRVLALSDQSLRDRYARYVKDMGDSVPYHIEA